MMFLMPDVLYEVFPFVQTFGCYSLGCAELTLFGVAAYPTETVQADSEHVAEIRIGIVLFAEHVPIPDVAMEDRCFSQLPNRIERFGHKVSRVERRLVNHDRSAVPGKQMIKLMGAYKFSGCVFWQVAGSIWQARVSQFPADYLCWGTTHIGDFQGIDQVFSGQYLIGSKGNVVLLEPAPVFSLVRMRKEFRYYPSTFRVDDCIGVKCGGFGAILRCAGSISKSSNLRFGMFNEFVSLMPGTLHLSKLVSRRLPLKAHKTTLPLHLVRLKPHDLRLTAIDQPRKEHDSSLQKPNDNQKLCKEFGPSLYCYVVSSRVCLGLAGCGCDLAGNRRTLRGGLLWVLVGVLGIGCFLSTPAFDNSFFFWTLRRLKGESHGDHCDGEQHGISVTRTGRRKLSSCPEAI